MKSYEKMSYRLYSVYAWRKTSGGNFQSSGMRLLIILRRLRIKVVVVVVFFFLSGWKGIRKPFKYDKIKLTLDFQMSSKNGKPWVAQCTSSPHSGGMQGSVSPKLLVCVDQ